MLQSNHASTNWIANQTRCESWLPSLHNICAMITRANVDDASATEKIYTHLFQLICDHDHIANFQKYVFVELKETIEAKLLTFFHTKINICHHTLGNIVQFMKVDIQQFEHFFECSLQPWIVYEQDQSTTPCMKMLQHPFNMCKDTISKVLTLYQSLWSSVVKQHVELYIQYMLSSLRVDSTHQMCYQKYTEYAHILSEWMTLCTKYKVHFNISNYVYKHLILHIPIDFLTQSEKASDVFLVLRNIVTRSIHHHKLFFHSTQDDEQDVRYNILRLLCHRFELRNHWSKSVLCVKYTYTPTEQDDTILFFWKDMYHAFCVLDTQRCLQYYKMMYIEGHPLHSIVPFTRKNIMTYFCKYLEVIAHRMVCTIPMLCKVWFFINELFEGIVDDTLFCFDEIVNILYSRFLKKHGSAASFLTALYNHLVHNQPSIHTPSYLKGFFSLWSLSTSCDQFLNNVLMSHIQPAILSRTFDINVHNQLLVQWSQSYAEQSTHSILCLRELIKEYQHRSFHKDAFVIQNVYWKNVPYFDHQMTTHEMIRKALKQKKTLYENQHTRRNIQWSGWLTLCVTEFTWIQPDSSTISMRLYTNAIITSICMNIHENETIDVFTCKQRSNIPTECPDELWISFLMILLNEHLIECISCAMPSMKKEDSSNECCSSDMLHNDSRIRLCMPTTNYSTKFPISVSKMKDCETVLERMFSQVPTLQNHPHKKSNHLCDEIEVIQTSILHFLKRAHAETPYKEVHTCELRDHLHSNVSYTINDTIYEQAIQRLIRKEYISLVHNKKSYVYIP